MNYKGRKTKNVQLEKQKYKIQGGNRYKNRNKKKLLNKTNSLQIYHNIINK